MPLLDPVAIAGKGLDEFRRVFCAMKDPDKRKVIKVFNLAPAESLTGRDNPKGNDLAELMWTAAMAQVRPAGATEIAKRSYARMV
ncbi:MAG: hypothetical protein ACREUF_04495, partial [Solimonas sp.]